MRRAALIALLALAASACTLDVNVGIKFNGNGSGSLVVDILTDDEFEELYRLTGRDFEDLVATRGTEVGLAFTVTPGANTRYAASANNLPAETVAGILEGLAPGSSQVLITRNATTLEFDGELNPLTNDVAPYFTDSDPAQFAEDVAVTVTLEMDGELDSSTATSRDRDRLTWNVPFSDGSVRLFARSVLEEEGSSVPWTLLILAGIIVVAAAFLIAIRSQLAKAADGARPGLPPQTAPAAPDYAVESSTPEDQPVAPDATPPEDQPVAPPDENGSLNT